MAPDKQEFVDLLREIRQARAELRQAPDVVEIQKKVDALPDTPENLAARRKIQAEARILVETRLREIPGMPEKLRRLAELAEQFRSDLPETAAREGKRLPQTADRE